MTPIVRLIAESYGGKMRLGKLRSFMCPRHGTTCKYAGCTPRLCLLDLPDSVRKEAKKAEDALRTYLSESAKSETAN